MKENTLLVSSI